MMNRKILAAVVVAGGLGAARVAEACGCFAPPAPTVDIIQAGERILFAYEDGKITAHIQIQYQGDAEDFGWLLPLPSVPTLKLGLEDVFDALAATTRPRFEVTALNYHGNCYWPWEDDPNWQSDSFSDAGVSGDGGSPRPPLVVTRDSLGPYDYAVLRADTKAEMLAWLNDNGFFIPTGTDDAVVPYIRPGAYFLALKLRSGQTAGDIQPVVIEYAGDRPMIPIVLTSVGATENMGIQAYLLGPSRGIPRNFRHTVINEALIDWRNPGANYAGVVTRAVDEAPGHHAFVTEYAGPDNQVQAALSRSFRDPAELRQITDVTTFVTGMYGYKQRLDDQRFFGAQVRNVLAKHIDMPAGLLLQGITTVQYYANLDFFLTNWRGMFPELFEGFNDTLADPAALVDELLERYATPLQEASGLFERQPYLTRMYTTLSPAEMTTDPAFGFNPDLGDVSNLHNATIDVYCSNNSDPYTSPRVVTLSDGRQVVYTADFGPAQWANVDMPASSLIEILGEEGQAEIETDNRAQINAAITANNGLLIRGMGGLPGIGGEDTGCDCRVGGRSGVGLGAFVGLALLALAAGLLVRRRQ
jgi:hypothetical protein